MGPKSDWRARIIEQLVARYIADHPNAADTVEGIRSWWIAADMRDASRAEVQAAVDSLVSHGTLSHTALPDGTPLYARAAHPNGQQS
jgi:uncharacterized lipoprotein YddW (UPF0748 family)